MRESALNLSNGRRLVVLIVTTAVILGAVNVQILKKEAIVAEGETVLLRLAPQDPRSLLQGDYMALRYAMAGTVATKSEYAEMTDGFIVIDLAEHGEATFVALYEGQQLSDAQQLLRFRRRRDSVRLASDAYFFEEGTWEIYQAARFGELRVNGNGEAVLIGLRNDAYERLGTPVLPLARN